MSLTFTNGLFINKHAIPAWDMPYTHCMYLYIQWCLISPVIFIADDKIVGSTVVPVKCKERDGCVCFCYIRRDSSNVRWTDCYEFLTKLVYNKLYYMCNKFDFAVPSEQSLLRSSQQIYFLIEGDSTHRVTSPRLVQTGKVIYYRWMKGHSRTGIWIIVGFPTVWKR